ncbi:hypothetical protein V6N11_013771 [Hibiscus sabdariffa]|uniref:RNase H type-1 domain-containing protein n=2 Tax=Hibiscus sabdariffa TaxID=183260 RepID=A0ABR2PCW0_9ROSI
MASMLHDQWQSPRVGIVEINIYGAYNQDTQDVGIKVIARDESVVFLCSTHPQGLDALHAEFFVVLAGIQLALDKCWQHVHIESNSAIIVNKFTRTGPGLLIRTHLT